MEKEKLYDIMDSLPLDGNTLNMIMCNNSDMCDSNGMMLSIDKYSETSQEMLDYIVRRLSKESK